MNEPQEIEIFEPDIEDIDTINAALETRLLSAEDQYSRDKPGLAQEKIRRVMSEDNQEIIEKLNKGTYQLRVAKLGGEIVGMCVWDESGEQNSIKFLYTHPDFKKQGIGSKLIEVAFDAMGGEKDISLTTQSAQDFYAKKGFKPTDKWIFNGITAEQEMIRYGSEKMAPTNT